MGNLCGSSRSAGDQYNTEKKNASRKIKLTYFNAAGRAGPIRNALWLAKIPFEDERLGFAEFKERKATFPIGSLPVMDIDGVVYTQSTALLRLAGKLAGFYPQDAKEALAVDEVIDAMDDLSLTHIDKTFYEQDADKKKAMREALATADGPIVHFFTYFEKLYGRTSSPFLLDKLTVADLKMHAFVGLFSSGMFDHVPTTILDSFVKCKACAAAVEEKVKGFEEKAKAAKAKADAEAKTDT